MCWDNWIVRRRKALQPTFWVLLNTPTYQYSRGHRTTEATRQSLGSTAATTTTKQNLRDEEDKRRYGHHTDFPFPEIYFKTKPAHFQRCIATLAVRAHYIMVSSCGADAVYFLLPDNSSNFHPSVKKRKKTMGR